MNKIVNKDNLKRQKDRYIANFDYLFDDKYFKKAFINELIKTCKKLKNESKNEFDFIFEKENQKKTNTYLIIDYNIISISFISILTNEYDEDDFYKNILNLFMDNRNYYEKNLLISLAKSNIIYFNFNKYFYKKYILYRYTQDKLFILDFKGIAMKSDEIKNILNDQNIIDEFSSLIKTNYCNFYYNRSSKCNRKKEKVYFFIEESELYKNIFKEVKNAN